MRNAIGAPGWGIVLLAAWLLMSPPLTRDGRVLSGTPVPEWTPLFAYDSVARCEAAREAGYSSAVTQVLEAYPNTTEVTRVPLVQRALFVKCVPAEQIYPPGTAGGSGAPAFDQLSPGGAPGNAPQSGFRVIVPALPEVPPSSGGSAEERQPAPRTGIPGMPRR